MEQSQILNNEQAKDQEKVVKVATEIALKSHDDSVFLVTPRGAVKLEKGMYGGWLLRPPLEELDVAYGVWCFATQRGEAGDEVVEKVKEVREKVAKIAALLGVKSPPRVSLVTKWYRTVKVVKTSASERYAVYEIEPTDEEATATLAYVHYYVWWSRRGKCHGEICGILDKFSKLLKAEFKDAKVDETGVYVPYDVSKLTTLIIKLMSTAEKEVAEEEVETVDKGGEEVQADKMATYFIVVKLPPNAAGVIEELEKAVRQRLKELNVATAVWSVKADV
jgi:hypothetical protein